MLNSSLMRLPSRVKTMADLLSELTLLFKPLSIYLLGGLTATLIAEAVTFKINPFKKKQLQGPLAKYDMKIMRIIESIKKVAVTAGFKYKSASTTREMVSYLSAKFPEQQKALTPILTSIESHIYGGSPLTNNDFSNYSRWLTVAPMLQVVKSRVKV
ncbi:MAG: hypothetical protein FJ358_02430 [Thaumarchaeota archaeon]|nr:hypothetical protein [Nitrososphaerota archaeon]